MESVLTAAERILHDAGVPALPLSHLLRALHEGVAGARTLDGPHLRALLEGAPERFRVLDPWRGPWRFLGRAGTPVSDGGPTAEPWVVAVRDQGDGAAPHGHRLERRLNGSVRWLALHVDPRSTRSLMRWNRILLEALAVDRRAA